ncbi:MAG: hypothetical protein KF916_02080 [Microbacteriaceae bacterium]|nr:hypothetical protein [Microbacteriaceae bacterium]
MSSLTLLAGGSLVLLTGCAEEIVQDVMPSVDSNITIEDLVDGTYTATGSYVSPGGRESVEVTVSLEDGLVVDINVTSLAKNPNSKEYQAKFISGIANQVVGKSILSLNVSKVAGSSLTSGGFNQAITQIINEAS